MKESEVEKYLDWTARKIGGETWKFRSPSQRGVSDRIVCRPDGSTWFIELKRPGGRLSKLQELFAVKMQNLNQNYACLWSKEMIDEWVSGLPKR
jgi:hypothetical protein